MDYHNYLEREQYTESTIKTYILQAEKFTEWQTNQGLKINLFKYKEAIQYVNHLQKLHSNPRTINHTLNAVKHYFNYLLKNCEVLSNPFVKLKIQGEKKNRLLHNLLSSDELEDLYYSYDTQTDSHPLRILANKKNKVIVGLLVYQGVTTSDLKRLTLEHLALEKGKVYIPRGNIGNRRTLELKPWQVMEFIHYINEIRPQLVPEKNQEEPLVFIASQNKLADTILTIVRKLKKINHKVVNSHQIRASVIVNWLSKYNLRKVQILSGHKYISTTERYVQEDLKELQKVVNIYHPLS